MNGDGGGFTAKARIPKLGTLDAKFLKLGLGGV